MIGARHRCMTSPGSGKDLSCRYNEPRSSSTRPTSRRESAFWADLLGGTVEADDDWHSIQVDGEARLAIQLAPDHVPPDWPAGLPQQIHLDLHVQDIKASHDEVMALGASLLKTVGPLRPRRLPGVRRPRRTSLLPLLGLTRQEVVAVAVVGRPLSSFCV